MGELEESMRIFARHRARLVAKDKRDIEALNEALKMSPYLGSSYKTAIRRAIAALRERVKENE